MLQRLSATLKRASAARPLATASCTGAMVMSAGDVAAQRIAGLEKIDVQRNLVSTAYNAAASPVFYRWYRLMDYLSPGTKFLIPKVVLSQLITTGANNPCYLTFCNHAEALLSSQHMGSVDWHEVRARTVAQLATELPNLYGLSMLFWLPVTSVNFAYVPDHLKILWVSSCSVLWGSFVSYVAHRS